MANSLLRQELFSLCNCKCLSTSTNPFPVIHSLTSHSSSHVSLVSPSRHNLTPKLCLFSLFKAPGTVTDHANYVRTYASLDSYNSSPGTNEFRKKNENLASGCSSVEDNVKGKDKNLTLEGKKGKGYLKNGNNSARLDIWMKGVKGSEISSSRLKNGRVERILEKNVGNLHVDGNEHSRKELDDGTEGCRGLEVSSEQRKCLGSVSNLVEGNVEDVGKMEKERFVKERPIKKKNKAESPLFQLRVGLDRCSKEGDIMGALSLYDWALNKGLNLGNYHYMVLLYLCSSAAMGVVRPAKSGRVGRSVDVARKRSKGLNDSVKEKSDDSDDNDSEGKDENQEVEVVEIRVSDDVKKYALEKGLEIFERMQSLNVVMNEAVLTSVARMALAMGNGDMAFDMVKQMKSMGINPKLRSYGPALSAFCRNGDFEKAFSVEEDMLENGVEPEEPELEALLRVSIQNGKADRVYYLLHKLRTKVRSVSPSTADLIGKWFSSKEASRFGKRKWDPNMISQMMENVGGGWHGQGWLGRGKWTISRTLVEVDGMCTCCGEKLALIDLDPLETERFAESVASLAIQNEKLQNFQKFQSWLDNHGPFEAVVDAANVGLLSQNNFRPSKVDAVVNAVRLVLPSKKVPLIIVHNKRLNSRKMNPAHRAVLEKWRSSGALFATPTGEYDDWYWMYAAIKFKCLIVTNDEMRDHIFQLLGNDFFPKWKERYQVRFSFSGVQPVLHMPPEYSVVIQETARGHWHVPITSDCPSEGDRAWLCISRSKQNAVQENP